MKHERGQTFMRSFDDGAFEVRVCIDPEEGRYVTFTASGNVWTWTLRSRLGDWYGLTLADRLRAFWEGWVRIA